MSNEEYSDETRAILVVVDLQRHIDKLQAELAAANNLIAELAAKLKMADDDWQTTIDQSHYAAELEPWADMGKRAIWERWYSDEFGYICCQQKDFVHAPTCPIPSLHTELEAFKEALAPLINEVMNDWEASDNDS